MPRVTRNRAIAAPPDRIWELVADPHHMPRWWPLAVRSEDVREDPEGGGLAWTVVLRSEGGTTVRADFKQGESSEGQQFGWIQEIEGTPFAKILKAASVSVSVEPDNGGSRVAITSDETLRGMSRLGRSMIKSAAQRRLDEALDGIERAVVPA
jgi:uncharacterized protein YndB with AHSA1/START domain